MFGTNMPTLPGLWVAGWGAVATVVVSVIPYPYNDSKYQHLNTGRKTLGLKHLASGNQLFVLNPM